MRTNESHTNSETRPVLKSGQGSNQDHEAAIAPGQPLAISHVEKSASSRGPGDSAATSLLQMAGGGQCRPRTWKEHVRSERWVQCRRRPKGMGGLLGTRIV